MHVRQAVQHMGCRMGVHQLMPHVQGFYNACMHPHAMHERMPRYQVSVRCPAGSPACTACVRRYLQTCMWQTSTTGKPASTPMIVHRINVCNSACSYEYSYSRSAEARPHRRPRAQALPCHALISDAAAERLGQLLVLQRRRRQLQLGPVPGVRHGQAQRRVRRRLQGHRAVAALLSDLCCGSDPIRSISDDTRLR